MGDFLFNILPKSIIFVANNYFQQKDDCVRLDV